MAPEPLHKAHTKQQWCGSGVGELSPLGTFFSRPKASKMPKHVFPRKASAHLLKAFLLQIDFIGVYVCVCLYVWEG